MSLEGSRFGEYTYIPTRLNEVTRSVIAEFSDVEPEAVSPSLVIARATRAVYDAGLVRPEFNQFSARPVEAKAINELAEQPFYEPDLKVARSVLAIVAGLAQAEMLDTQACDELVEELAAGPTPAPRMEASATRIEPLLSGELGYV